MRCFLQGRGPRRFSARLALAMLVTVAACSRPNEFEEDLEPLPGPIPVRVKNENFLDMNVSVLSGGVARRLGQVSGNGSADFKINWSVANGTAVSVVATAIGSSARWTSPGLSVRPGQMIEFRIGSVIRQSNAVVREAQ